MGRDYWAVFTRINRDKLGDYIYEKYYAYKALANYLLNYYP